MKVIVVHVHEAGQGSDILAVLPADEEGLRVAGAMARAAGKRDEAEYEAHEIMPSAALSLSDPARAVLRAVHRAESIPTSLFPSLAAMIDRGLVKQIGGGTLGFILTPLEEAALSLSAPEPTP